MVEGLDPNFFDALLPGAACKAETRDRIDQIARERGISKGQVMRAAVEFFLNHYSSNSRVDEQIAKKGRRRRVKAEAL